MQKITLRPLRLVRFKTGQLHDDTLVIGSGNVSKTENGNEPQTQYNNVMPSTTDNAEPITPKVVEVATSRGDTEAHHLLKRAPKSYFFNQVYGLWFFISWFLLTVMITRSTTTDQYGSFAIALTASNTILYIIAFGLEDATTTYVPRVFAEHGQAAAAQLIRRLLALRLVVLILTMGIMLFGLPIFATLVEMTQIEGSENVVTSLRDPRLLANILPLAIYVLGSGLGNLLNALCAALMRMRLVLFIGSIVQAALLGIGLIVLQLGWGINGILWLLAVGSLLNAAAFALWLAPFIFTRGATYTQPLQSLLQLSISAWLTNLASGALLKQVSIILLGFFAVSVINIGYFNLSFQLADSANLLLVAGFAGVGGSTLAVAFVGQNNQRLARSWQVLIKIETLLAAPGLIFCLFNAQNIAHVLYGSKFDPVGPLLAIFLFFNMIVRVIGTTIHQSTLYVLGKPKQVVLSQWIGMIAVVVFGVILIPLFGVAGALAADGLAKAITGGLLLAFSLRHLPRKYPMALLGFTLRFLLALTIAALPSILWHPTDRILLGVSGVIFIGLCLGLLLWIKPLNAEDMEMVNGVNPRVARYLHYFVQK